MVSRSMVILLKAGSQYDDSQTYGPVRLSSLYHPNWTAQNDDIVHDNKIGRSSILSSPFVETIATWPIKLRRQHEFTALNSQQSVPRHVSRHVMDDEKIVPAVYNYPCLWQVKSRVYKSMLTKANTQKAIAVEIHVLCAFVCVQLIVAYITGLGLYWCSWEKDTLQMKLTRDGRSWESGIAVSWKIKKKARSEDEGPPVVSPWPLFEVMKFLKNCVCHKR